MFPIDVSSYITDREPQRFELTERQFPVRRDRPIWETVTGGQAFQSFSTPMVTGAAYGRVVDSTHNVLESLPDQRVELLVRQFSGGLSREEFRRLELLNQRLTKLHPPVTNDEYVQLEKIVDLTEKAQKNNAAIRRRLNLD
ncbi:MAG TPA: hypothetical protein PKE49_13325 [Leptospiraceae bacterium]|nr:hypothetical protein [Leptospirales bacterium]HMW59076.1 hypothetical protein [Leptospiraceae bacterium]HMX57500.1 hypothetical protein [Leptospiraceae bacterium]HNJ33527.1 hypothetical protein [Leptospiraceae bacterium]HNL00304.1 hypothetical protein [Leptospiraceae bacterium]